MGTAEVIANYELLSNLTRQMRSAATEGEWEKLVQIEHQCSQLVADMKQLDNITQIDKAGQQIKDQLITRILVDNAAIQNLTEAWMNELQQSMQSNRQEQRLHQTYGM